MARINVSSFVIYDALFIFHNRVFPTYPENHDTKEGFCSLKQETKTEFFLAVKVKSNFNRCVSHLYQNSYAAAVLT